MPEIYHPRTKIDLTETIQQEWQKLANHLSKIPAAKWEIPYSPENWSVKDILAHIAAWEQVAIDILAAVRTKSPLPDRISTIFKDIDLFNANVYTQNRAADLKVDQVRFQQRHQELIAFVEAQDEPFIFQNLPFTGVENRTVQYIISANTHWHYPEHYETLQKNTNRFSD